MIWHIFLLLIFLTACTGSPIVSGSRADANRYYMTLISPGMTEGQVLSIMGYPYRIGVLPVGKDRSYQVWYYLTVREELGQSGLDARDFTPLFFKDGTLKGWGYSYYKQISPETKYVQRRNAMQRIKAPEAALPNVNPSPSPLPKEMPPSKETKPPSSAPPESLPTKMTERENPPLPKEMPPSKETKPPSSAPPESPPTKMTERENLPQVPPPPKEQTKRNPHSWW